MGWKRDIAIGVLNVMTIVDVVALATGFERTDEGLYVQNTDCNNPSGKNG